MIIVFGSNVLDLFFQQADLPPHDNALFIDSHNEEPGGKGANQAVAAAKAGAEVHFYGALGDGGHGRQMFKNLSNYGIDVTGIQFVDTPSGLATIFVDETDGTHRIVVSQGANLLAKQSKVSDKVLDKNSIVLVQGELPITETIALVKRAKAKGARTVMNFAPATQPLTEDFLRDLDIIILNEHEANALGKMVGIDADDKVAFACAVYEKFRLTTIVTLGPDGCIAADESTIYTANPLKIKAVDTVGAGDAFCGYFCAALEKGLKFEEALQWASVAGSLACTQVGAQTALPEKDEVMKRIPEINVAKQSWRSEFPDPSTIVTRDKKMAL